MPSLPDSIGPILSSRSQPLAAIGRQSLPGRVQRAVNEGTAIERGRGLVMAARVRALGHVASEAMQEIGQLSQMEQYWAAHAPSGVGRFQAIADIAAIQAAEIVADMGRE